MKGISSPPVKVDNVTLEKNAAQEIQAKAGVLMNYADIRSEIVIFTRDMSLASGTQGITLATSKTPKAVIFLMSEGSGGVTGEMSIGIDDGVSPYTINDWYNVSPNTWVKSGGSNKSIMCYVTGTNSYLGHISAKGVGTFTVTWTRNGAPTGTITIYALVLF
jgi:hypothetical protein